MKRLQGVVVLGLLACLCAQPVAAADKKPGTKRPDRKPAAPAAPAGTVPSADSCTEVQGTARYEAYGYTHVVALKNNCEKPVTCALWTDVDPEPRTTVQVAPRESIEIVTRKGSPAREVTGLKSCTYR